MYLRDEIEELLEMYSNSFDKKVNLCSIHLQKMKAVLIIKISPTKCY